MSLDSVADEYRRICEEIGVKPVASLEEALARSPETIDLSLVFFSSAHFESIIQLIERRFEIKKVDLSGMQLPTEQLVRFFSALKGSCVRNLVLRNVVLDVTSGEALKKLSTECEGLTDMDLSGTMLPEVFQIPIMTQVELNKVNCEEAMSCWRDVVEPEAPKSWRWRMESWTEENSAEIRGVSMRTQEWSSLQQTLRGVMANHSLFSDKEFPPEVAIKDPNVLWMRVSSLEKDSKKRETSCVGGKPLYHSVINDTQNLCSALNIVQQVHYLRKHLCIRRLPEIGVFAFRFFVNDTSVEVVIDDQIPLVNGVPGGIHHGYDTGDYWGCLVEKAFAKLHGGYENISGVAFGYALSRLTGGICFEINWKVLKLHFTEIEMFSFLRGLINTKKVLASLCIPSNAMITHSLEEKGICPYMSYIVSAAEAVRDENPYLSYVVQLSCPNETMYKDALRILHCNADNVSGLPRYWISFENYLAYFDRTCLLLWPQSDPLTNHKCVVEHLCNCFGGSDSTSTFATNPSFLLANQGRTQCEVMIVLRRKEIDENVCNGWIQMHIYKGIGSEIEAERRYNISSKNKLLSTEKMYGDQVALVICLGKNERLQLTTSASPKCKCTLTAASVDPFQLIPLPSHYECTIEGEWGADSTIRPALILININKEKVEKLVVALSQKPVGRRTFGIGVKVFSGDASRLGNEQTRLTTEYSTDVVVVFSLKMTIEPNESVTIIPLAKTGREVVEMSMSVYCEVPLQAKRVML
ncbi:calpain-like cysteine peptidase [Trypanosoma grayi]|uniref:calpain-like cysteine peptidase n=1 Tax=Trypanosoma grayi TaxID=71804 RepID=UPI0004F48698|nr:calpain-like cysteine peptidase [Trypanosoma grayi]KEG15159.1 calpain-like cysteine peptidase [Trypanosoma grayi]